MTTLDLQAYSSRKALPTYSPAWFDTEHQNIQRAIESLRRSGALVDPRRPPFSAAGDGSGKDDTAPLQDAINTASAQEKGLLFDGKFTLFPATAAVDAVGPTTTALTMKSKMHIYGVNGATLKIADGQSTDAAPKGLYLFFTSEALADVSIRGLDLDMNGANNKISPNRGAGLYDTSKNMAHIGVSGTNARIDDMIVEWCKLRNTPGTNQIVAGHSSTPGIALGQRWRVAYNLFKNNGSDTSDHSAVYAWVDWIDCFGNWFWEDDPYGTVGHTGAQTAYEVHGAHQNFHHNFIKNYYRMAYIANNYTSDVYDAILHDNEAEVTFEGVAVFRSGGAAGAVRDSKTHDNKFRFIEKTYAGAPGSQIAFNMTPELAVSDLSFTHNEVSKTGPNTIPAILALVEPTFAGVSFDGTRVNFNRGRGLTGGVQFRTNGVNGGLGYTEAIENEFVDFVDVAGFSAIGLYVDATNGIKTLVLDRNKFIDERGGAATFGRGIFLNAGTITDLFLGPQVYKGLTIANYTETGGIVITKLNGLSLPLVDRGDASVTLNADADSPDQLFATALTVNRTVTLGVGYRGSKFRVTRTGLGAFTLDVGGLKTIPAGTAGFVDVEYSGAAWRLTGYGLL